jgi:hypothetical protein
VTLEVALDFIELEAEDAAEPDGPELSSINKPVDGASAAVEQPRGLRSRPK